MGMINCPNCHKEIGLNSQFCPYCGTQFKSNHHYLGRFIVAFAAILMLGTGGVYAYGSCGHQTIGIAKQLGAHLRKKSTQPGFTLATFPKNIQGTWYSYDEGKLQQITITPTSIQTINDGHNFTTQLHSRSRKADAMKASNHINWSVALPAHVRGIHFTNVRGWNQGAGDGESYGIIHNHGVTILEEAGGAESWNDSNFYRSRTQAKHHRKQVYKNRGEKVRPSQM